MKSAAHIKSLQENIDLLQEEIDFIKAKSVPLEVALEKRHAGMSEAVSDCRLGEVVFYNDIAYEITEFGRHCAYGHRLKQGGGLYKNRNHMVLSCIRKMKVAPPE